jgi:hypothetical protein
MSLVNFAVALAVPRLGARISDGVLLAGGSPSCPPWPSAPGPGWAVRMRWRTTSGRR